MDIHLSKQTISGYHPATNGFVHINGPYSWVFYLYIVSAFLLLPIACIIISKVIQTNEKHRRELLNTGIFFLPLSLPSIIAVILAENNPPIGIAWIFPIALFFTTLLLNAFNRGEYLVLDESFPYRLKRAWSELINPEQSAKTRINQYKYHLFTEAYDLNGGDKKEMAKILNYSEKRISQLIKEYNLDGSQDS